MSRARLLVFGFGLAFLAAACAAKGTGGSTGTGGTTDPCGSGQMTCNGSCVNVLTDNQNCGTCGLVCDTDAVCQGGTCVAGGSTGGTTGSGGSGTGGATTGTGGNTPTGGTTGTGGTTATGGTTGTGGSGSAGTTGTGNGGTTGTGGTGTTNQPVLVTSAASGYWKTTGTLTTVTSGTATVTVNDTSTMQNWEGFGGAFNELGWLALSTLSASDQSKAIDALFGSDAAHFAVGRVPIGASDYSCALSGSTFVSTKSSCDFMKSRYTADEGGSDPTMANFTIARDGQALIPYVKAALQANSSLRLWASPWTPPTWMKTGPFTATNGDNKTTMSNFDSGNMKSDTATLTAYSLYLRTWVKAYLQQGIKIEAISAQNEPTYAQDYPSCIWTTSTYTTFIGQLGQDIAKDKASGGPDTHIMLGTMSNSNDGSFVSAVMGNATAKAYPKVLGYQWGMEGSVSGDKSKYGLPIWETEHRCGNYPGFSVSNPTPMGSFNSTMAPNDWNYGWETWELIRGWIGAGVTSYSAWNMVLDTIGLGIDTARVWPQDSLLTVNTSTKTLTLTPAYYVFRHCSQYVQPGATVVGTSGGEALAWKNPDGSLVTVMYNSGSAMTYTVAIGGKKVQFAMPAQGWATVYMPAS
jgi:glucosylceramidase